MNIGFHCFESSLLTSTMYLPIRGYKYSEDIFVYFSECGPNVKIVTAHTNICIYKYIQMYYKHVKGHMFRYINLHITTITTTLIMST